MSDCQCKLSFFGYLIWSKGCQTHDRCDFVIPGVGIRCILTAHHKGDHA